ncbi:hypothetical protein SEA_ZARBODNAMRA_83 [Gordonia phage Zarbodnamra]|nr:hypothetical protein SEA_ZARBODNAMRA_83 [Gordonia phage Zarbodnamra]
MTEQEWHNQITAEIDVLAHDAKLGTAHEQHEGWRFELDTSHQFEDRTPIRVLTCGCGAVLVNQTREPNSSMSTVPEPAICGDTYWPSHFAGRPYVCSKDPGHSGDHIDGRTPEIRWHTTTRRGRGA